MPEAAALGCGVGVDQPEVIFDAGGCEPRLFNRTASAEENRRASRSATPDVREGGFRFLLIGFLHYSLIPHFGFSACFFYVSMK